MKSNQCLLDYKKFYKNSSHLLFPAILCFPQYFAFTISSIFYNIVLAFQTNNIDLDNLCHGYLYEILPIIIDQIFGNKRYSIKLDINKLKQKVNGIKNGQFTQKIECVLLETYLADEESISNYRNALLDTALIHYECKDLNEIITHLYKVKCLKKRLNCELYADKETLPSSEQYLLISDDNNVNTRELSKKYGTSLWGPFYWNIIHSIAETQSINDKILIDYVYVLPFTLPCNKCTFNYLNKMDYFKSVIESTKSIKKIYSKIHDQINYDVF